MTCNDCICSEVCYYKSFNDVRALQKRRNDVEKICKSFVHRDSVKNAPTVDAVEVVHGKAVPIYSDIDYEDTLIRMDRQCNKCGALITQMDNYCPNCGAKMDGDGNG